MIERQVVRPATIAAATCSFLLSLGTATPVALAAEIKVMSTVALNAPLDELKPKFESATGNKLTIVYGLAGLGPTSQDSAAAKAPGAAVLKSLGMEPA